VPYVSSRSPRRAASMRQLKKKFKRAVLFVVVIIAATYALNFFFKLGTYLPTSGANSSQDAERELLMKKLEDAGKKAGQIPAQPSRR